MSPGGGGGGACAPMPSPRAPTGLEEGRGATYTPISPLPTSPYLPICRPTHHACGQLGQQGDIEDADG